MTAAVTVSIIVIVLLLLGHGRQRQTPPRRIAELPTPDAGVQDLLASGRKIAAIKAYREQTGASLLEAKRVIDQYGT